MKNDIGLLLLIAFVFLTSCKGDPEGDFKARVIGVKDGDTIEVLRQRKSYTIRFAHIDCPERKQAYGAQAKQFVLDLCYNRKVEVVFDGETDRYGRLIAEVYVASDSCINMLLVENGFAWHFKKYSDSRLYDSLETAAQRGRRGLWIDEEAISPWEYRTR